jgi:hypothetical protein
VWQKRKWWIIGGVILGDYPLNVAVVGRSNQVRYGAGAAHDPGPGRVTLGSDVAYDVQLANDSGTNLTGAELIIIYPDGFSFTTSEPPAGNPQGTEFAMGDLASGDGYTLRINGRLTGGVKTEQRFIARATFSPAGSPERLQVESSTITTIETAAFTFTADGPETSLPNNPVTFSLDLENNEQNPLEGLRVRATTLADLSFRRRLRH